jgi:ankyrin repeat protein
MRGWTPLFFGLYNEAQDRGFPEVIDELIAAGADMEHEIGYAIRPLMLAAGYGEAGVVERLLKAGADPLARNEGGRTALMMVKEKFYVDVINLLHEAEIERGVEASCDSRVAPNTNVVKLFTPPSKSRH